jgi:hypothetical protein
LLQYKHTEVLKGSQLIFTKLDDNISHIIYGNFKRLTTYRCKN